MAIRDLESAFANMLSTIAEMGGSNVELNLEGPQQQVKITRMGADGKPVEEFTAWYDPKLNKPLVAYALWDTSLLNFQPSGACQLLGGVSPTKADLSACNSFIGKIGDTARKRSGEVVSCHKDYSPNRIPFLVAYFAERMIPEL